MTTKKQRSALVEAIKTGKVPRRRNLFKKLFALIGEPDKYLRIGFSDGPRGKENDKHRVVLVCRPSFELTDEKLAKLKLDPAMPLQANKLFSFFAAEGTWDQK